MNEKELEIFKKILSKTEEIYNIYLELSKLDNQKRTTNQLDIEYGLELAIEEADELYESIVNNKSFIIHAKELIKQLNPTIVKDDIFFAFANKKTLILKRIYNELTKLEINDAKSLNENLTGYFKEKAKKVEYSAYLYQALPNFNTETSIRTIELLENTNLKELKYNLSFINSTLEYILIQDDFEKFSHTFDQNIILNTVFYISEEDKHEFKNVYGYLLMEKTLKLLSKVKNEKLITYLNNVLRVSSLFIDENILKNITNSLKEQNPKLAKLISDNYKQDLINANRFDTEISKETLNIIKQLLEISSTIKNIYNSLQSLEEQGNINTKHYANMLNYLNMTLEEEKTLYEYFNYANEEIIPAYNYILELIDKKDYRCQNIPVAIKNDEDELIIVRVYEKLYNLALDNDEYFHSIIDENDAKICSSEEDFDFIKYTMKEYDNIHNLESFRYLSESHEINDIYYKYNLAFLNNKIEEILLNNGLTSFPHTFKIHPDLPVSEKLLTEVNNKYALEILSLFIDDLFAYDDSTIFDEELDEDANDLLIQNIEELSQFNENKEEYNDEYDEEYEDDEDNLEDLEEKFYYNILISKLKACLLFADEQGIKQIKNEFLKRKEIYPKYHDLIFKQVMDIIDNYKELQKDASKDLINKYKKK